MNIQTLRNVSKHTQTCTKLYDKFNFFLDFFRGLSTRGGTFFLFVLSLFGLE